MMATPMSKMASTRTEANEVVLIGNICLVVRPSNRKDSLEYANNKGEGRRAVTEQDINALSASDRERLANFLYDEWKAHDCYNEYGWFHIAGENQDGPLVVVSNYYDRGGLFVVGGCRPDILASRVVYVEVAREAEAPIAPEGLRRC